MVAPGTYTAQAFKSVDGEITKLGNAGVIEVVSIVDPSIEPQAIEQTLAFQMDVAKLQDAIRATSSSLSEVAERMEPVKSAIQQSPNGTAELMKEARELELKLKAANKKLNGDQIKESKFEQVVPSIGGRVGNVLFGSMRNTYGITKTQKEQIEIARQEFATVSTEIKNLLDVEVKSFEAKLNAAGIPWTPGRPIPAIK
jgi:hypothetical protein